jgi:hypothetical protein
MSRKMAWAVALGLVLVMCPAVLALLTELLHDGQRADMIMMPVGFLLGISAFLVLLKAKAL